MIDFLKTNISWLKDVIGSTVSIMTVTIAVFTYCRAKSTIFQPLRTEVIKHQMSLFERIVEILDPITFIEYIDYQTIAASNLYLQLRKFGCTFGQEIDKEVEESVGGEIIINTSNVTLFPPLLINRDQIDVQKYPFPSSKEEVETNRKKVLEGIIDINSVLLTNKHCKSIQELTSIRDNPWLPKSISKEIDSLIEDINHNLRIVFPQSLCLAIREFCEATKNTNDPPKAILPGKLLNYTLVNGNNHEKKLKCIQEKIRKHLRIDYKW